MWLIFDVGRKDDFDYGNMNDKERPKKLRGIAYWTILAGAALYAFFHFGFIVWQATRDSSWLVDEIVKKHYAAVIVLPSFGFAAACLIILFDQRSTEQLRFKALGFEFSGASAPIVLWIACFLACASALKLTW